MSAALQVALFLACLAVVLLVSPLIPPSILLYRRAITIAQQLQEVKNDLKQLMQDSRAMVQNVNLLSTRANQQLDELDKIVRVVGGWSERVNHVVQEVGAAVEAPVLKVARGLKILRQMWGLVVDALVGDSGQTDRAAGETRGSDSPQK